MVKDKTISLCMVVYNQSELTKRAVDSARSKIDEVVIVDQGSSEKESSELQKLADIYIKTTNKGNADFDRNYCYALSTKEYILAMDSDETIEQSEIEKLDKLFEYDFDVIWFLFKNTLSNNGSIVDLKKLLGDDPHPRLWKKHIEIEGRKISPINWPIEAHKFPDIISLKQIFSSMYFTHSRFLEDVIKTHLHRGLNIAPEAVEVERNFIRGVLNEFPFDVKKQMVDKYSALKQYLN